MSRDLSALVVRPSSHGNGHELQFSQIQKPTLAAHEVLVKVQLAAQNPTDVQSLDNAAACEGGVLGCDFVGTVEELGAKVTRYKPGDVVAGLIWGGEVEGRGAFGYYTVADENISFKVPEGFALEQAATVPLASATAWLALFSKACLGIPMRSDPAISVFIWGGSSSVGQYAIQIAANHGFNVITTCSPKYFETVKSLGARHVFDYHDQDVATEIKEASSTIHYAFDTIGQKHSSTTASQALAHAGEKPSVLCTVRPGKANTEDVVKGVKVTDVLVWTAFLKDHRYGEFFWPASDFDHEICVEFFKKVPGWLSDGQLRASVPSLKHGLESVADGFQEYRDGKISGYKLVYRIQE